MALSGEGGGDGGGGDGGDGGDNGNGWIKARRCANG